MVIESIFERARQTPEKCAIRYANRNIGYGELATWVLLARQFLNRQDLRLQSVAVLDIDSLLDNWVFCLALQSLGLTTVAVNLARL
jgi:hypothetical protein